MGGCRPASSPERAAPVSRFADAACALEAGIVPTLL